jgi:predicted acetyltransferase
MISTTFPPLGVLADQELRLDVLERTLADPARGWVPAYKFRIVVDDQPVGRIDLRLGDTDFMLRFAGQVGYGIDPGFRGQRYAARALVVLKQVARLHGFDCLWITCNPDNLASRRTCELAGAELVEIVDLPEDCDMFADGDRSKCRYRLPL